ncbi:acetyl-CoA carboxylase carboxyltransferase subunit alpha [Bdellovibrionota bacterium FG-2]
MESPLEFEKPISTLEKKLLELRELAKIENADFSSEITALEEKIKNLTQVTFSKLSAWQRVQLSRHPSRPYMKDYVSTLFPDFLELHGDRTFGEDPAITGGLASWPQTGTPIVIIGHQKGRTTKQKIQQNFGMPKPEGYRKAVRLMEMANRFQLPLLTLIDTPGAYPGIEAEERGQSEAIAQSLLTMFDLEIPVMAVVIGEGGSGGALALSVADKILMQEYSIYAVISPESCASILWSDPSLAEQASEKLKLSPQELLKLKIIDGIIPEPLGGAHRNWEQATALLWKSLQKHFGPMIQGTTLTKNKKLAKKRIERFRSLGNDCLVKIPS